MTEQAKQTYRAWYPVRERGELSASLARHARLFLAAWMEAIGGRPTPDDWVFQHARAQARFVQAFTAEQRKTHGLPDLQRTVYGRPFAHATRYGHHLAADTLCKHTLADLAPLAQEHALPLPSGEQLRLAAEDALTWAGIKLPDR